MIDGETTLNINQLRNGYDNTLDELKSIVKTHLDLQGATNRSWHVHKSIGSFDEVI